MVSFATQMLYPKYQLDRGRVGPKAGLDGNHCPDRSHSLY
jgi:hypothetical protein